MDPDVAEVSAQARLHEPTRVAIERGPASGTDNLPDWRRLLLLEGGTDAGVAVGLLEVHHRGRRQHIGSAVHQCLVTGRLRRILALGWRLAALGIEQELV